MKSPMLYNGYQENLKNPFAIKVIGILLQDDMRERNIYLAAILVVELKSSPAGLFLFGSHSIIFLA